MLSPKKMVSCAHGLYFVFNSSEIRIFKISEFVVQPSIIILFSTHTSDPIKGCETAYMTIPQIKPGTCDSTVAHNHY